jgi:O-acetyl-ADP-ribose deacetylase (regulator of RNase III)
MTITIIFFDINSSLVESYQKVLQEINAPIKLDFQKCDVSDLLKNNKLDAVVSPANSFGDMSGGIDKVYTKIFPDIQSVVKKYIAFAGLGNGGLGTYLPVGKSLLIPTNVTLCPYLIVAPTMYLPRSIRYETDNIKKAFLTILDIVNHMAKKKSNITIACSGLGTGVGCVDPTTSANKIKEAIKLYYPTPIVDTDNDLSVLDI